MTVVIGITCEDGIVIACDSQVEFNRGAPVKRLNANKIYRLKGDIAIAGAGMISFIQKAIDGIKAQYDKLEVQRWLWHQYIKGTILSVYERDDLEL